MAKTEQKDSLLTKELDLFVEHNVKDILDLHPWMSDKTFRLLTKQREIEEYIDRCIQSGICALDLETTGLNTRIVDGKPAINLVGICLACSDKEGIYIPVGHTGYSDNVPLDIAVHMLKILCNSECILIFHNFKYDGEVLRGLGIILEDENKIEDTLLLTAVDDASRKQKGLKYLSENLIGRPMLEINNLGVESSKKKVAAFSEVSPKKAVIYGGSDAMNTYALFFKLKESMNQQDPTGSEGPWRVYKRIEKPALFVVMEMERNLAKINVGKLEKIKEEILKRMAECATNIVKLAGREFDINSPKQLGEILFNEMKIRYPLKEKNANGTYSTDVETLEMVQKANPIVSYVLNYRSYQKTLSTYVENFLKNVDKNGEIKFQLNQVQAETGRFSASGGSGIVIDGYCGVNCQNISTYDPDEPTSFDLRDAVEAHEGFVIVAVDYSGEELRIAANLSKEPNWIKEFLHGTGDIHTITAKAAFSKSDVTKTERKVGKCVAKGTLVATEKGWLPIENIKKGDLVITKSGTLCPVEEVWDMGTKPGVKIETTSGHAITCGLNHRFLDTENNWVRAEDLKSGMKIKTSSCSKIDPKEKVRVNFNFWNKGNNNLISKDLPYVELNYHWGKLIGYILGDGSMHTDSVDRVCSPAYSEVKDDILRTMDILGLPHTEHLVHREGAKNPLWTIHMGSTILCRFFQHIGFRGRRGKVFRVPRVVFESPKEVSAGFLSGLFETDGTVEKSELSVTTKDKELAQDLVLLLASFGIKAYIYEHPSKKYNKVYYKVGIGREGAEIFEKDIGFISTSKNNKLKLITNKRKTTKSVVKWETTIKKVEMLDSIELMDLTVSEDHTYVAQGLITHNTLNFQTLYGGGPGSFAAKAGITIEQAKKLQSNFFKNNPTLRRWMDEETKITKRRMFSKTALGRRRNLKHFYMAEDSYTQSKGDRCAINSAIQGCLQISERCLTSLGYLSIEDILNIKNREIPIKVWTGTSWEEFEVWDRGKAELAEIELKNGMTLHCDTRHEVLVVGDDGYKFKHYKYLDEDTNICVSIPQEQLFGEYPKAYSYSGEAHNSTKISVNSEEDWDAVAYLLGYMMGDGWVRCSPNEDRYSVTLYFGKKELDTNFINLKHKLRDIGVVFTEPRKSKGSKGVSYTSDINSRGIVELLISIGYQPAVSTTKRIPKSVFTWPVNMRKEYLRGYYDSDGSKSNSEYKRPDGNRYGTHTPNKELLIDTQMIGWTLGCASNIYETKDGNYRLSWSDLWDIGIILGVKRNERKRRYNGKGMYLPDFLREQIVRLLEPTDCLKNVTDRAYLSKIRTGKPVTVPGVVQLLRKYKCTMPQMYYHYKLKRKDNLVKRDKTYTLSVFSDLHRFDSAGIISKNTGADIIKLALYRVWKWIHKNGYQDDVKILLPVHDEIVYEMREDKLDFLIPEIVNIMQLRDVTDRLGWEVPLVVDAEYGKTWRVEHDFFKEKSKQEKTKEVIPQQPKQENVNQPEKAVITEEVAQPQVSVSVETATASSNCMTYSFNISIRDELLKAAPKATEFKEETDPAASAAFESKSLKDRVDEEDFFVYTVFKVDFVVSEQFATVMKLLVYGDSSFVGHKKRIKVKTQDGKVIYTSSIPVSIDAFVALCTWLNL